MLLQFRTQATVFFMQLCDSSTGCLFRSGLTAREKHGKKGQKSGCSCTTGGRESVTHYYLGPFKPHTHPTILISVSGLDQIHCAFCWERPGINRRTVPIYTKHLQAYICAVLYFSWILCYFFTFSLSTPSEHAMLFFCFKFTWLIWK
jgi:hypothetical protein